MTDEVQEELQKHNVVIPGCCTSKIQPLDICLNKPFKSYCLAQWTQHMQEAVGRQEPGECIKTPTKQHIVDWVMKSNSSLAANVSMVKKSFLVCEIWMAQNALIHCCKELQSISIAYGCEAVPHDSAMPALAVRKSRLFC